MLDKKLTDAMAAFLMKDSPTDEDIINGAGILLRINRNRSLHQMIVRRPQRMLPKLVYELQKHLRYRKDGKTLQEVRTMQKEIMEETQRVIDAGEPDTPKRGKRADHDSLPDEIKSLWNNNAERYKALKATFETCKVLDEPCDRYEYLLILKEGYEAYKRDMATYDSYDPNAKTEDAATGKGADIATDNAKTIGNARAYISKNRDKFVTLSASDDTADQAAELRQKIQERVNALVACNAAIDEDTKQWLTEKGFTL